MAACTICALGVTDLPDGTNVALGKEYGVSESSVRRHRAHLSGTDAGDDRLAGMTLRGATIREADGSYYRYAAEKGAVLQNVSTEDIEKAISEFSYVVPEVDSGVTAVLNASDLQIGKALQRGGGTPETIERVMQSFSKFAALCRQIKPAHIILVDGGDPIENVFNVPSQAYTNDLDVPAQIRTFRRLMVEGIKMLAPLAPEFTYLAVPSNHGAFRTGYKSQAGSTDADFGLEISTQIEDIFAEHESLNRVKFVRPEPLEETAVIESSGTKMAFHHGHQSSGPNAHGKWWSGLDHGRRPGWDADIMVVAHYHSLRVEQSGNGRWIIGVSSSDPGSDWFSNRTGESARQGMTSFTVKDGMWSNLEIL